MFTALDVDGNGCLDPRELRALGVKLSTEHAAPMDSEAFLAHYRCPNPNPNSPDPNPHYPDPNPDHPLQLARPDAGPSI